MNQRLALAVTGILMLTLFCPVGSAAQTGAAHPEMVVSTQWLAQHLEDPKVVVVHVAQKRSDYEAGHIPGARLLLFEDFMEGEDAELPPPEKLKDTFEKLGVSNDSHVVVYTTAWYPLAGRAYYTLDYLGHGEHTSLLDGGIIQWKAEKRPLETTTPAVARSSFTPHLHPEVRAMLDDVKKVSAQDGKSTMLVDSRPDKRYTDGHIAGAVHLYWRETVVDEKQSPVFLPPDKLRELFAGRGIQPGQKLITYCEIGWQASHNYFVAKYLGYDAAMFDGSIHVWDMVNHLPLVAGKSPR
jgi:thiosulfate/3-mercaptopyruvate sulfurtransferase